MAQDLRKIMKDIPEKDVALGDGHESRFEARLAAALPKQEAPDQEGTTIASGWGFFLKIAAVVIMAGGIVWFVSKNAFAKADSNTELVNTDTPDERVLQLSDLSPQFKKVEDYYLASINLEIARLEVTDENKALVDSFLKQLARLDAEYERLNKEITESGISEEMVNAMVENLKLRLELLSKLKQKLNELKASQDAQQTV